MDFVHLHNHSHYSVLDGLSKPEDMIDKAKELGQKALALTDHGTMMGLIDFYRTAKAKGIKPILGCEMYLAGNGMSQKDKSNPIYHLVLLAKNNIGYKNLMYMSSQSYLKGFYRKPRIDWELLKEHSEGLIATSACLAGEIPRAIMKGDLETAREVALRYLKLFGKDNYYLEIQHHPSLKDQHIVNCALQKLSEELDIGLVATNDSHYVNYEDRHIQDALICINTGKMLSDTNRMSMLSDNYSLRTTEDMVKSLGSFPKAIENTVKIASMCNCELEFNQDLVPVFNCPAGLKEKDYLRSQTEKGLQHRYGIEKSSDGGYGFSKNKNRELPLPMDSIIERMDFELETINKMGYPGYFLIVQDFILWSKNEGILVGPGRGSAAGSLVSYLLGITDIDPLKYDLLFERFLNPDRISMPDIDIDFQDDRRDEVLNYVSEKYGEKSVCQVVTYQKMAAKNSIRDMGRVMGIPLPDVNKVASAIHASKLAKAMSDNAFVEMYNASDQNKALIDSAMKIEGTIRGTGTHACAVIISENPVYNYSPLMYPPKDNNNVISQYEGPQLEALGLLKMDFLGLRNLSIISNCLAEISKNHQIDIDINNIPLDDDLTYSKVYAKGDTHGIFQFESAGMKKYLKILKPNRFEDLVAMNALYRPGPMDYIPSYINRKHGKEKIIYDHPLMEKYLKDTYGITVFQEQVMLLSRELANFSRGMSDSLRKAIGKKKQDLMAKLKIKFMEGCLSNSRFIDLFKPQQKFKNPQELVDKIWGDWEAFASYAFNKSHSVCYAYVSYQTAYLKAHYPAEYMTAMLNSVIENADKVVEYVQVCEDMKLEIVRPDVNHSQMNFAIAENNKIAFGLNAIKNVGKKALESVIFERETNGKYKDFYDFLSRIDLSKANKRTLEYLARAGAMDSLNANRAQTVESLEILIPHFQLFKQRQQELETSLLADYMNDFDVEHPPLPDVPDWDAKYKLSQEKEFTGFYITGHPLSEYRNILDFLTIKKRPVKEVLDDGYKLNVGGLVRSIRDINTKSGKKMSILTVFTSYGDQEIVFFEKIRDKYIGIIEEDKFYVFEVRVSFRNDFLSLVVQNVFQYEQAVEMLSSKACSIEITIRDDVFKDELLQENFINLIKDSPGNERCKMILVTDAKTYEMFPSDNISGNIDFLYKAKELLGDSNVKPIFIR